MDRIVACRQGGREERGQGLGDRVEGKIVTQLK
jgi:hypothetical protein